MSRGLDQVYEVQGILDQLVGRVVDQTPYQRALASLYGEPLSLHPRAEAPVVTYAAHGLTVEDQRQLRAFVDHGGTVRAAKFAPEFRLGDSYFIPAARVPPAVYPLIRSRRRFVHLGGWRAADLLLVPLRVKGQIIGQLSVDDPADGARPTPARVASLESLTAMAALALTQARVLQFVQERYRLFHFLAERAMTGLLVVEQGRIRYANDQAVALLGYPRQELQDLSPWWQLFDPSERPRLANKRLLSDGEFDARAVRRDGGTIWVKVRAHPMDHGDGEAVAVQLLDISDRIRTEELLKERAIRDPLTGLFNRYYFEETVVTELHRSQRYKRPFTIMLVDVAGFKRVNDRLGHHEGDRVLQQVAQLIRAPVRQSDWVVRYGGDEFLIVLPETGPNVESLVHRLKRAVEEWAQESLQDIPLGVDVGWATWTPDSNLPITALLREADARMYAEKRGRQSV
ncbi:MAG: sensor domain-containing diguanylate cyclase [Candidatus Bipolaricaulaceae bacterium]